MNCESMFTIIHNGIVVKESEIFKSQADAIISFFDYAKEHYKKEIFKRIDFGNDEIVFQNENKIEIIDGKEFDNLIEVYFYKIKYIPMTNTEFADLIIQKIEYNREIEDNRENIYSNIIEHKRDISERYIDKLTPCKKCGSKPIIKSYFNTVSGDQDSYICCPNCNDNKIDFYDHLERVYPIWNERQKKDNINNYLKSY